ncbi:MAG: hypothetical protein M3406_05740 [Chloroflexota bacterium]|nr:hypothetical protein [Chloroflexota bacterium]
MTQNIGEPPGIAIRVGELELERWPSDLDDAERSLIHRGIGFGDLGRSASSLQLDDGELDAVSHVGVRLVVKATGQRLCEWLEFELSQRYGGLSADDRIGVVEEPIFERIGSAPSPQDAEHGGCDVAHVRIVVAQHRRECRRGVPAEPDEVADGHQPHHPRAVSQIGDALLAGLRIDRTTSPDLGEGMLTHPFDDL